jgi:hypothetical protein
MCDLEQAIRHHVLAIYHIFEGSLLAHDPFLHYLSSRLQVLAHDSDKVPSATYPVTQEQQNVYDYGPVSSIGAGEEGRRMS